MISILTMVSNSLRLFSKSSGTVPSVWNTTEITVTLMFQLPGKIQVFFKICSLSFIFALWSAGTSRSTFFLLIIIIILIVREFFSSALANSLPLIFLLSLSDSKSPQASRTLFSILTDLNNVVFWMTPLVLLFPSLPVSVPVLWWPYRVHQLQLVSLSPSWSIFFVSVL